MLPTTANVAPRPVITGADIASGLAAGIALFTRKPWIAASIRRPAEPLHLPVPLTHREDVEAIAADHGTLVEYRDGWAYTNVVFDGVRYTFNAAPDDSHTLRRDPEATAVLAERDA